MVFKPGMFFFQNCFEIQELATLNVNDSLGREMAWLVNIRHMHPDELQSRIAWTAFHNAPLVF